MRIEIDSKDIPYQGIVQQSFLNAEDKLQLTQLFEKLVSKGHLGAAGSSRLEYYLGKLGSGALSLHPTDTLHHFLLTAKPGAPRVVAEVNLREGPNGKTKLQLAINGYLDGTEQQRAASRKKIDDLLNDPELDINLTDKDGWSAAYQATQLLDPYVLEQIALKKEVRFNSKNKDGSTPLIRAADRNNISALKVLLAQKIDVNRSNDVGTALTYAVKKGHQAAVQFLLEAGADANKADMTGASPLALAKKYNQNGLIPLLERYGAKEGALISAIHAAVKQGSLEGMEIEKPDEYGRTAAHYCALENNTALLACLKEKGANLDRPDRFQRTPLHYACIQGNVESVRFLKQADNINLGDKQGQTPLHFAAEYNQLQVIRELEGADVNRTDNFGWTPLDKAAAFNSAPCCAYLCGKVDVNRQGPDGRTALHKASINKSFDSAAILLQNGAKRDITDSQGKLASEY